MPAGDALGRDIFVASGDGTTTAGVTAGLTAWKQDLIGVNGTAHSATNPVFSQLTNGTNVLTSHDATALVIDDVNTNDGIQTHSLLYGYDDTGAAETWRGVHVDTSGNIVLSSDIEIGAVEIKNADTDDRVDVHAINTAAFGFGMGVLPARYMAVLPTLTDTFGTSLYTNVNGELLVHPKGYDTGTDALKTFDVDPISGHYVVEDLAEVTTQGDGTTYYYILMDGYRNLTLHWLDTPGIAGTNTYTLEASVDPDEAGGGTGDYFDVSTALGGAANWTTDQMVIVNTPVAFKYLRVKVVRINDGANTDGAWTIHEKRLY